MSVWGDDKEVTISDVIGNPSSGRYRLSYGGKCNLSTDTEIDL